MKQAFIIMQIGDEELDKVCVNVIVPALRTNNLDPKRVDKHNRGGLLKSEIIGFINQSNIIVADLTNERPNCYLEVGYAMGRDKYQNLILTARDDHNPDSADYVKGGPKVHFDLTGYDILWWNKGNLDGFRKELEKRIKRRLSALAPIKETLPSPLDEEWFGACQSEAFSGFKNRGQSAFMEVGMALYDSSLDVEHKELLRIAEQAQIHTTGWPIGVVLHGEEKRPKPTRSGIVARIVSGGGRDYDYWALRKDGQFYLLRAESSRKNGAIGFDTKIVRIAEILLYCTQLYAGLGASTDARVYISIRHGGLKDYVLTSDCHRILLDVYRSTEEEAFSEIDITLGEIKPKIVDLVEKVTKPFFSLFDFFTVPRETTEELVNDFVAGKIR
jgi:hypothetical protein